MNTNKKINEIAARHGMTPGQKMTFTLGGMKFNGEDGLTYEIETATLREGKNGNTTLKLHGFVTDPNYHPEGYTREIGYWEINENELPELLKKIDK